MTSNQSSPTGNKKTTTPVTNLKTTTTTPPAKKNNPMRIFLPIAIIAGLFMISAIGYLAYQNSSLERKYEMALGQMQEQDDLRVELENQFNQSVAELEDMRSDNEELNEVIDQQQEELETQKNKIAKLIRQKKDLGGAKAEIEKLKVLTQEYLAQIESLKAENELLASANTELQDRNSTLQTDLDSKISENSELNEVRAVLVSQNEDLNNKVSIASVIKVDDIEVTGFKMKGNGKPAEKKTAKAINQLKVCFTTEANEVAKPGLEKFYIRIVSPIGETLAVEELGNNIIMNKKTGEEVPFTEVKEYDYANDETELCFLWEPNISFTRGNYEVDVFNKGFLAGKGTFSLR